MSSELGRNKLQGKTDILKPEPATCSYNISQGIRGLESTQMVNEAIQPENPSKHFICITTEMEFQSAA
jgi:hypothetical protein